MSATPRFPVICGPTAGGKSALAVEIAFALKTRGLTGEIVTADAFQVYKGMDIGTAKPTLAERRGVPHHLIDLVEPTEKFTLDEWLSRAEEAISSIRARGGVPIVVGGTHLYVKALLEGLFEGPGADAGIRARLTAMSLTERRAELERVDPAAAKRIHPNDERRTVRALEVFELTGKPISDHQGQWDSGKGREDALLVCLQWPVEVINPRINARVKAMMAGGLLEEVRTLRDQGRLGPQSREALGYKQLVQYLEDQSSRASLDEAIERIKIETRHFAKSQRTWLRRLSTTPGCLTLKGPEQTALEMAESVVNTAILTQ